VPDAPAPVAIPVVDVPAQAAATQQPARTSPGRDVVAPIPPAAVVALAAVPAAAIPPTDVVCAQAQAGLLGAPSPTAPLVVPGAARSNVQSMPTESVTPAPGVHHSVPRVPAPLDLPVPAPAPVCPSAGTSTGISGCGTGHGQHTYSDHVVLGSRSTTPTAAGPAQPDSNAADEVADATDDPGTRPG
jgi:hypothetical protein